MRLVCIDGSFASFAHFLKERSMFRIWVKFTRDCPSEIRQLTLKHMDVGGSMGNFVGKIYTLHASTGNAPRMCSSECSCSDFFEYISDMDTAEQAEVLRNFPMCGRCEECEKCICIVNEYGVYDLLEQCDSSFCCQQNYTSGL